MVTKVLGTISDRWAGHRTLSVSITSWEVITFSAADDTDGLSLIICSGKSFPFSELGSEHGCVLGYSVIHYNPLTFVDLLHFQPRKFQIFVFLAAYSPFKCENRTTQWQSLFPRMNCLSVREPGLLRSKMVSQCTIHKKEACYVTTVNSILKH